MEVSDLVMTAKLIPPRYTVTCLQRVLSPATFRTLAVLWVCVMEACWGKGGLSPPLGGSHNSAQTNPGVLTLVQPSPKHASEVQSKEISD